MQALQGIFSEDDLKHILEQAVTPENKKRVLDVTKGSGAFGAPWIVAVNNDGEKKEFFGNDRWDQIFYHLKVPYTPVSIVPPEQLRSKL